MMRYLILFCLLISQSVNAGLLNLDGTYQGENLYVQNPYDSKNNSFCISKVTVNDKEVPNIHSGAFEIELDQYKIGEYLNINIIHDDDCSPRVLNAEALRSKSTFELISIKIESNILKWTTKGESSQEPFIVEKFKNNKWVPVGKVTGKGPEGFNNYMHEILHHSGSNRYRIKQRDVGGRYRFAGVTEYFSKKEPITFYPKRVDQELFFSEEAEYEIYDSFGSLVNKGVAKKVMLGDLEPGIYYINVDNETERFLKK